ncbi:MAG: peptidoglycan DD-metalloendopeptidase family protein [Firmicutes bacterium]|nr:peptidoglycan DD-metalloendopeptidase family protein [Bacillota bacterium]
MVAFYRINRLKILIVTVLVLTLVLPTPTTVFASQLDSKREELKDVQTKIEANKSTQTAIAKQQAEILEAIKQNDQKIASLQSEVNTLQEKLDQTTKERKDAEAKLKEIQETLEATQAQLVANRKKLAERRAVFNSRLIGTYKNRGIQIVAVILNSRDFRDFIERTLLLGTIAESDGHLVKEIKYLEKQTSDKVTQIGEQKRLVEDQRLVLIKKEEQIAEAKNKVAGKQRELQEQQQRQQELFSQAQRNKVALEQAEEMLVASSNMIANQIRTLEAEEIARQKELQRQQEIQRQKELERQRQASAVAASVASSPAKATTKEAAKSLSPSAGSVSSRQQTARFIYPASGPITSGFGMRFHPVLGYSRMHTGIDIGVPTGTLVHASASGTVIMAGWMGGYGNAVVISHGGGISTLYGHNSALLVSVGQYVSQGQVIARSGSTGLSTGPHLHFEIRLNGTPVDPMKYL